ncbi:2-phospho-L-lactate transferase [Xanthobacter autotrophicus DSM 431]|uniref:2-phospho-L-lactate transferase n=1 Tax=Xanthobacter nonsaccharivorans TaxID=3119912 RepID=UPI0037277037
MTAAGKADAHAGPRRVLALCGGVGGAKLAFGLQAALGPALTVMVNTGDDFTHLGLAISPDIDTVLYTLAGLSDPVRGWGRAGETWQFMSALRQLGGEDWFQLGDLDLAMHVERTGRLAGGARLSEVVAGTAGRLGLAARILPMSDDPVRTMVETPQGLLAFQHYFVRERCAPPVLRLSFEGAETARILPELADLLAGDGLDAVIICPSNPYLSIDPILALPGLREALALCPAPVVAVSPLIGGRAVKGPTAKIMDELGIGAGTAAIAAHYLGLADGLVIDTADAADAAGVAASGLACRVAPTLMTGPAERVALADECLAFARELGTRRRVGHAAKAQPGSLS